MLPLVQCLFTLCMWAGADCLSCVNPPSSSLSESFEQHPAVCTVSPSCLLLMELATPLCSSSVCVMKLPSLLCSVFHTRTEHTDCVVCVCVAVVWLNCCGLYACVHAVTLTACLLHCCHSQLYLSIPVCLNINRQQEIWLLDVWKILFWDYWHFWFVPSLVLLIQVKDSGLPSSKTSCWAPYSFWFTVISLESFIQPLQRYVFSFVTFRAKHC